MQLNKWCRLIMVYTVCHSGSELFYPESEMNRFKFQNNCCIAGMVSRYLLLSQLLKNKLYWWYINFSHTHNKDIPVCGSFRYFFLTCEARACGSCSRCKWVFFGHFSSHGQSPGRAIVLPPASALAWALAVASALAKGFTLKFM